MRLYIIIIILCAFLVSCKEKKYNYKSKGEWVHLKNGETIGFSEEQKIKITESKAVYLDGNSLKLEL